MKEFVKETSQLLSDCSEQADALFYKAVENLVKDVVIKQEDEIENYAPKILYDSPFITDPYYAKIQSIKTDGDVMVLDEQSGSYFDVPFTDLRLQDKLTILDLMS